MKSILVVCFMWVSTVCYSNEWVPYRNTIPAPTPVLIQPVPILVPLFVPYVPVFTYDSVLVEHKQWCLFKRYDIVNVPKVVYMPIKY